MGSTWQIRCETATVFAGTTLKLGELCLQTTANDIYFGTAGGNQRLGGATAIVTALDDVGDVTISAVAAGEVLKWSGTAWINNTLLEANIPGLTLGNTWSGANTFNTGAFGVTSAATFSGGVSVTTSSLSTTVALVSTLATGTAPLTIASTTVCTNLNADMLDGSHIASFGLLASANNWAATQTITDVDLILTGLELSPVLYGYCFDNDTAAQSFLLTANRGRGTRTTPALVSAQDRIFSFAGRCYQDATTTIQAAYMSYWVDGTPGASNDMPGRACWGTTPDGSATSVEAFRITCRQNVMLYSGLSSSAASTDDTTARGCVYIKNTAVLPASGVTDMACLTVQDKNAGEACIVAVSEHNDKIYLYQQAAPAALSLTGTYASDYGNIQTAVNGLRSVLLNCGFIV